MKLTVKEYSTKFKISAQAVYQKLNKGTLKSIEENGIKYVTVDSKAFKELEQPLEQVSLNYLFKQLENKDSKINKLEKKLDDKNKEIKKLNKKLINSIQNEKQTLISFISELKHLQLKAPVNIDDDIIDVKEKKKKSKKKRKKNVKKT